MPTQAGGPTGNCTMTRTTLPPQNEIKPDTPLRLSVAAGLAFPGHEMAADDPDGSQISMMKSSTGAPPNRMLLGRLT